LLGGTAMSGLVTGAIAGRLSDVPDESNLLALAEAQAKQATPRGAPARSGVDVSTPDEVSLAGIPPYPGAAPRSVTRLSNVVGVPVSASWFTTADSPDAVLAFYENAFGSEEHVSSFRDGEGLGYVAYRLDRDLADGGVDSVLRMVTVVPRPGENLVLVSNSQPQRVLEAAPVLPDGVALPEGAREVNVVSLGEVEGGATVTATVSGDLPTTRSAMVKALEGQGWVVMAQEGAEASLAAKKGAGRALVWLETRPQAGETMVVLQVQGGG
jgi:predicted RNA binding protein YcfA (HicA-like mRNA interferase family)